MAAKKGMGFKAAAKATGLPKDQADKVIGAGKAKASPKAKAANPNLRRQSNGKMTPPGGGSTAKGKGKKA